MKRMKRPLVLVSVFAFLIGFMYALGYVAAPLEAAGLAPRTSERWEIAVGCTLGFLLLGGWIAGELFRTVGLPRLSGYLLFGVVCGPNLSAYLGGVSPLSTGAGAWPTFLPEQHLRQLVLIDRLAIALIALTAGSELRIDMVRRIARRVVAVCAADALAVGVALAGVLYLASDVLPLMGNLASDVRAFVCIAIATLMISNSPAVVIALLKETRASGPMQELALAVTIAKDLLLIVATTALLAAGVAFFMAGDVSAAPTSPVWHVVWHLIGSIALGAAIGVAMTFVLRRLSVRLELVVGGVGLTVALLASALGMAPLLMGLAAGFVQANAWPDESQRFTRAVGNLMLPVAVVFFANTGAGIDIHSLAAVWPTALAITLVRLSAVALGASFGARLAGVPLPARRWVWTAFVPQAGVSLALAQEFQSTFDSFTWARPVYVVLVAVIAMNELIGPPLFRLGLARTGEVRA